MLKMFTLVLVVSTLATLGTCLFNPTEEEELKCLSDNNITKEELYDNKFPLLINNGDHPVDQKYKNYAKCAMKILGLRKEDGTFDLEKFAEVSKTKERKELVLQIGNECMAKNESVKNNEPEYAFGVINCVMVGIEERVRKQMENEA